MIICYLSLISIVTLFGYSLSRFCRDHKFILVFVVAIAAAAAAANAEMMQRMVFLEQTTIQYVSPWIDFCSLLLN
jgi:hypothetical protein